MKIGQAENFCKDLIAWREQKIISCCCRRNCLHKKENTWKPFSCLRRMAAAKFCQINGRPGSVSPAALLPSTLSKSLLSLQKKIRENDSVGSREWRRNSVKSMWKNVEVLQKIMGKQFNWLWKNGGEIFGVSFCSEMASNWKNDGKNLESDFVLKCLYFTKSDGCHCICEVRKFVKL